MSDVWNRPPTSEVIASNFHSQQRGKGWQFYSEMLLIIMQTLKMGEIHNGPEEPILNIKGI